MDASGHERMIAEVRGRVQGVGFRWFVRREARALGLTGRVRNEPDGSVRVEAEGPREDLDRLAEELRAGPPGSRVDDLRLRHLPPAGMGPSFEIG
jgi:acylphosphatase